MKRNNVTKHLGDCQNVKDLKEFLSKYGNKKEFELFMKKIGIKKDVIEKIMFILDRLPVLYLFILDFIYLFPF